MKKVLLTIVFVLSLSFGVSSGFAEGLANENLDGLYANSIEHILRLPAEQVDLGTAALIISEQWSDTVPGRKHQTQLDDMAYAIRAKLKEKNLRTNYKAIAVINEYLFEDLGFKAIKEATNPDDLFLHTVLDERRGYCLSLSVLYLAIGERLGLPLHGVVVPGHFFVRYDDGRTRFNIETTSKGGSADDKHYMDKFKVPLDRDSIYMANLDKIQTLGCFFNNLGNSYSEIGDIEMAVKALERAVQINPLLAESHTNLGNMYLKQKRVDEAITEYVAALKIQDNDAKMHNNLGNAYLQKKWYNDAIGQYTRATKLDPDFADAYINMSAAHIKAGDLSMAEFTLKRAITLKPKDSRAYNQLGNVYYQMKYYDMAILRYEKALSLKIDSADAYYGLGLCYNGLDRVEDEIKAYKKALKIDPSMMAALMNLGNTYFGLKQYDKAVEQYQKAIRYEPANNRAHYNIGAAYSNSDRFEQAVAAYEKAVQLDPKMADAHNGLAFAYYRLEDYQAAWRHIKIAEELGAEISSELLETIEKRL
jgi:tetratricopeptide (TPR) repeat protein